MKKYIILLLISFALNTQAQNSTPPKLDDNTIVKDLNGNDISAIMWKAYLKTGDYTIRYSTAKNEFSLYKLTPEEKEKMQKGFEKGISWNGYWLRDLLHFVCPCSNRV